MSLCGADLNCVTDRGSVSELQEMRCGVAPI